MKCVSLLLSLAFILITVNKVSTKNIFCSWPSPFALNWLCQPEEEAESSAESKLSDSEEYAPNFRVEKHSLDNNSEKSKFGDNSIIDDKEIATLEFSLLKPNECAKVFEEDKHKGRSYSLKLNADGDYGEVSEIFHPSSVSSFAVRKGCALAIYSEPNFQGDSSWINENLEEINQNWALKVKSLICSCGIPTPTAKPERRAPPLPTNACARIYSDMNYVGTTFTLQGDYEEIPAFPDEWDNTITSFAVKPGCAIGIFSDKEYQGDSSYVSQDLIEINGRWDNRISSVICSCASSSMPERNPPVLPESVCAKVFTDLNYQGKAFTLQGTYAELPVFEKGYENTITSFLIKPGCALGIFTKSNFQGLYSYVSQNLREINERWDNNISSLICSCDAPAMPERRPPTLPEDACAQVYSDQFYSGAVFTLLADYDEIPEFPRENDKTLTSFVVRPKCSVGIYSSKKFKGQSSFVNQNLSIINEFWDNKISSLTCACEQPPVVD